MTDNGDGHANDGMVIMMLIMMTVLMMMMMTMIMWITVPPW